MKRHAGKPESVCGCDTPSEKRRKRGKSQKESVQNHNRIVFGKDENQLLAEMHDCYPALFIRRYKRFLADVKLLDSISSYAVERQKMLKNQQKDGGDNNMEDEGVFTCYVPNTGKLTGLLPTATSPLLCILSKSQDTSRKYQFTVEAVRDDSNSNTYTGIHSSYANDIANAILQRFLLSDNKMRSKQPIVNHDVFDFVIRKVQREMSSPVTEKTRFDFKLQIESASHAQSHVMLNHNESDTILQSSKSGRSREGMYAEVKSVTFATTSKDPDMIHESIDISAIESSSTFGLFPDTESKRGQKHLSELMTIVKRGGSAMVLFIIQRGDVEFFAPFDRADPQYAKLLREAVGSGVKVKAISVELKPSSNLPGGKLLYQNARLVPVLM